MSARSDRRQDAFESPLRRLSVFSKVLSAAMLASVARLVVDGIDAAALLTTAMLAVLLAASVALWRHGRQLQRRAPR